MDGVLFEFAGAFIEFLKGEGIIPAAAPNLTYQWNFTDVIPAEYLKQLPVYIHAFFDSPAGQRQRPMVRHDQLISLKNLGVELYAVTQQTNIRHRVNRIKHLSHCFGPVFTDVHFTRHGETKFDYIEQLSKRRHLIAFIEDRPATIQEGLMLGYPMWVSAQAYNEGLIEAAPKWNNTSVLLDMIIEEVIRVRSGTISET